MKRTKSSAASTPEFSITASTSCTSNFHSRYVSGCFFANFCPSVCGFGCLLVRCCFYAPFPLGNPRHFRAAIFAAKHGSGDFLGESNGGDVQLRGRGDRQEGGRTPSSRRRRRQIRNSAAEVIASSCFFFHNQTNILILIFEDDTIVSTKSNDTTR